jgi:hypothetical protein
MELTHKDFLEALHNGDTAKWILEEDHNGVSHYYRVDTEAERNPWATNTPGPATIRNQKVREQMKKRVSKHGKPFVYRLGYNHCIGQFAGQEDYPTLSGSSFNRNPKKKETKPAKKNPEPPPHFFSTRSRGKVKDKATAFYRSAPGERIFLTLTFIEHVEDREGCKILNKFLTVVRKECPGFQYLRVAEHQPENPKHTIHFHILMNRRLAVRRYNALWVLQQYNAGLRGHDKYGNLISFDEILDRYDKGTVQKVLNPLDVRKAYGINALSNYLVKYITKQKHKDPFGCLNWHCSRRVSKLFTREVVAPSTFAYLQTFNNCRIDKQTGELIEPTVLTKQFFTMVYVNNKALPLAKLRQLETVNRWIINGFDIDRVPRMDDDLYRKIHPS